MLTRCVFSFYAFLILTNSKKEYSMASAKAKESSVKSKEEEERRSE